MIYLALMKISKVFFLLSLLLTTAILTGCTLPFLGKKQKAALQVTVEPKATVFLNEAHLGQTPFFDENLTPGEYKLKIVPESNGAEFLDWQGVIKLSPGILTVVSRSLGKTEEESSGYVLNLEPIAEKNEAKISIISTPDGVVVALDGEPKGFTPLSLDSLEEGEYVLTISSPGWEEKIIKAKTVKGHKLSVNVQLAEEVEEVLVKEEEEEKKEDKEEAEEKPKASVKPSPSPQLEEDEESSPAAEEEDMELPYVKIKSDEAGYLNVRSEPSIGGGTATVVTKVYPGEVYPFIEKSEDGVWYKIEYEEGKQGWVSGKDKYTTVYE